MVNRMAVCFFAGLIGGLVNSLTVWLFGTLGITRLLGVAIAPVLTEAWLYPRLVWGGLWGLVFCRSLGERLTWKKGAAVSLLPTLFQLFVVFPFKAHKGVAGLDLGTLTPLCVLFFNAVWGVTVVVVLRRAWWHPLKPDEGCTVEPFRS